MKRSKKNFVRFNKLHISRATEIKVNDDDVSPKLVLWIRDRIHKKNEISYK